MTLQELGLTDATIRKLNDAGIDTAEGLTKITENELYAINGVGRHTAETIEKAMYRHELFLKGKLWICGKCTVKRLETDGKGNYWLYCPIIKDEIRPLDEGCECFRGRRVTL